MRHLLEVAQFKRNKAYCLLRDASSMLDAGYRAHLVQYAKYFEEEAVKLEERAGDIYAGAAARMGWQRSSLSARSAGAFHNTTARAADRSTAARGELLTPAKRRERKRTQ